MRIEYLASDPLPIRFDKSLHFAGTGATGHNDFDPAARVHLDRQASRTLAFAHGNGRRLARPVAIGKQSELSGRALHGAILRCVAREANSIVDRHDAFDAANLCRFADKKVDFALEDDLTQHF